MCVRKHFVPSFVRTHVNVCMQVIGVGVGVYVCVSMCVWAGFVPWVGSESKDQRRSF